MVEETNLLRNDTYVSTLASALVQGESLSTVPDLIIKIIDADMWRERKVRQTKQVAAFKSFREFVEAYPPEGLHTTIPTLLQICRTYNGIEAADRIAKVEAGERGGNHNPDGLGGKTGKTNGTVVNVDSINIDNERQTGTGTSTTYTMRRLAKDAPELHKRVLGGEITPNAAAIEAGFRKAKFQVPQEAEAAGLYFAGRVDREWFEAMADAYFRSIPT